MTRPFNATFHCPICKTFQTQESMFGRWIRNNPWLDSRDGYCVVDQDYWIHQFKSFRGKDFQLIMMVEIKTNGAELTLAQKDTLHIINQITRNRKQTPTKSIQYQSSYCNITKVMSVVAQKEVYIRSYGAHVLTFSSFGPDDSEWIKWDGIEINEKTLTKILMFDLDPDTLKQIDLRYHHIYRIDRQEMLPFKEEFHP